jgi:anti-sigma factor RsiW
VTCREFASFMLEYLTGELSSDARTAFERHLSRCRNCTEYLAQYRATIVAGRVAYQDLDADVPEDVPDDLVQAILASWRR